MCAIGVSMNTKKVIIIIGTVVSLLLSIYVFDIQNELLKRLSTTEQKIEGLKTIDNIHNLDIALKHKRGISQFNSTSEIINNTSYVSNNYILNNLEQLENNEPVSIFKSLSNTNQNLSKSQLFNLYTKILKILNNDSKNIAESSNLLYESQKDINILISIAILNVSSAIEEIGQLRGNITRILNLKKNSAKNLYMIKNNLNSFLKNMENIKFLISKLPSQERNEFIHLINEVMTDYNDINKIVYNIEHNRCTISPEDYFLKATKFLNDVNTIFVISKDTILNKLEQRQKNISNQVFSNSVIYTYLSTQLINQEQK